MNLETIKRTGKKRENNKSRSILVKFDDYMETRNWGEVENSEFSENSETSENQFSEVFHFSLYPKRKTRSWKPRSFL